MLSHLFHIDTFAAGWLVGLLIAIPVGPIALLTIKRTLQAGVPVGFATGMGAALADTIYGAIAAFGIMAVQDFLKEHTYELRLVGGAALLIIGLKTILKKLQFDMADEDPVYNHDHKISELAVKGFFSGLILTLTNPMTLVAFAAVLANFGISEKMTSYSATLDFVFGVLVGAASWWMLLATIIGLLRKHLSARHVWWIKFSAAIILVVFGALSIYSGVFHQPLVGMESHAPPQPGEALPGAAITPTK